MFSVRLPLFASFLRSPCFSGRSSLPRRAGCFRANRRPVRLSMPRRRGDRSHHQIHRSDAPREHRSPNDRSRDHRCHPLRPAYADHGRELSELHRLRPLHHQPTRTSRCARRSSSIAPCPTLSSRAAAISRPRIPSNLRSLLPDRSRLQPDPKRSPTDLHNIRGTIAMAKLPDDPDSATSQWFINLADNSGPPNNLDTVNGGFTVFGTVSATGMTMADAIAALPIYDASLLYGAALRHLPLRDYTSRQAEVEQPCHNPRDQASRWSFRRPATNPPSLRRA